MRKAPESLRVAIVLVAGGLIAASSAPAEPTPTPRLKSRMVRGVERCLLDKAFVFGVDFKRWPGILAKHMTEVEESDTNYELASGFNRALAEFEVSHLQVATPAMMEARRDGLTIGAGLKVVPVAEGQLVTSVVAGSPADVAGIERGDLIVSVDGTVVDGAKSYPELIDYRLSGAPGSTRTVVWSRQGVAGQATIGFAEHEAAPPISLEWENDIALLTVPSFRWEVYDRDLAEQAFTEIGARARGLIIDVRSNSGGRFSNVMHLASFLVPQGSTGGIITERGDFHRRRKALSRTVMPREERLRALGDVIPVLSDIDLEPFTGPVVVLIDGSSGSGGDLFPAILQDERQATLVGSTTVGALLGGQWCDLPGGFELVYPSQEILRPSGGRVEGVGVSPDIELTPRQALDDNLVRRVALGVFADPD